MERIQVGFKMTSKQQLEEIAKNKKITVSRLIREMVETQLTALGLNQEIEPKAVEVQEVKEESSVPKWKLDAERRLKEAKLAALNASKS